MIKNNSVITNKNKNPKKIQTLITSYFKKKIYGYDELENTWRCCQCGVDMGPCNPRQLCGKYRCDNDIYY
jgi:hypothetical protein